MDFFSSSVSYVILVIAAFITLIPLLFTSTFEEKIPVSKAIKYKITIREKPKLKYLSAILIIIALAFSFYKTRLDDNSSTDLKLNLSRQESLLTLSNDTISKFRKQFHTADSLVRLDEIRKDSMLRSIGIKIAILKNGKVSYTNNGVLIKTGSAFQFSNVGSVINKNNTIQNNIKIKK